MTRRGNSGQSRRHPPIGKAAEHGLATSSGSGAWGAGPLDLDPLDWIDPPPASVEDALVSADPMDLDPLGPIPQRSFRRRVEPL